MMSGLRRDIVEAVLEAIKPKLIRYVHENEDVPADIALSFRHNGAAVEDITDFFDDELLNQELYAQTVQEIYEIRRGKQRLFRA